MEITELEIKRLIQQVLAIAPVPMTEYTRGYLNALEYIAEWASED